ncbi:restriction endonuclease subunit S [Stenotrophomonas maltophilia]|uniref:restriction endonuclease subunit S n=1 Tax=Stenotrophomonas maltophilia TaxID=40324 RepID=UPI0015DE7ABF|nr:restriction endonuclease subunit S [Stenotrophomonas maltophilia]MBA0222034.1 restriction endonuclease subunit S [Stenotrophomonas maltophilia]
MNMHTAQLLEKHFDTAFAAPNGIKKLRELILTLAMQGKLVPQDPSDQSASELLREIDVERQQLIKKGAIKKTKSLPSIREEEKPYSLPQGWDWARLQSFSDYNGRSNIDPSEIAEDTWLLDLEDIEKETSRLICRARYFQRESKSTKSTFREGDVLYGKLRPYLDKVLVADSAGVCTTEIVPIVPSKAVIPEFLRWLLKRPDFLFHVNTLMYGVKMPRLGTEDAIHSVHPIPPVKEQHRIVAKINELMVRCDGLEKLRAAQQGARVNVHAAAIKQLLNIAEPDQHQRAQAFLAEHFGELYTVKENVTELRKAILQLAVMGKLVPQNPDDQPASELLKEIEVEKQRLVKEGKIKKPKPLPPVTEEEKPYTLPRGWEWVRVIDIVDVGTGSTPATTNRDYYGGEVPWYTSSATNKPFTDKPETFITEKAIKETNCKVFPSGSLIIALYGQGKTRGQISELTIAGATNQAIAAMVFFDSSIGVKKYLKYFFIKIYEEIRKMAEGAAQPNLNVGKVKETLVPLPPLSEQHRIVEKIDAIMALCDSLEQQIDANTSKQTELLSALVRAQSQGGAVEDTQRSSRSTAQVIDLATYRACIGCYAINKLATAQYFGRTAAAKVMYLAQAHVGLELNLKPEREAAGPLDTWIYDFERQGQDKRWFEVNEKTLANGGKKTEYRCLSALSEPAAKAEALMSPGQKTEFDRLIYALADKKTEEVEIIATLFAVWNDFLIDGVKPTDAQIISDVRENWHERKARFTPAKLGRWLDWLRRENIIPLGLPPRTVQQSRLGLD